MKRKYVYKNATIYISNTNISYQNIYKATENFLKKALKEDTKWSQNLQLKN